MNEPGGPRRQLDIALFLEIGLGVLLLALALFLFWIPASRAPFVPQWWSVPLLAGLFFGIIALHRWRKREDRRETLHRTVREDEVASSAQPRVEASTRAEGPHAPGSAPGEEPAGDERPKESDGTLGGL